MSESSPELEGHPELDGLGSRAQREAFAVADRLAVHGSDCVCPPCASRLPRLLRRLAASLDGGPGPRP